MKKHVWFPLAGVLLSVCSRAKNISGQNTPPRFPDGDFTRWVYDRTEFPAVALKDRTTGPATFLISISKEGKISRCRTRQYPHAAIRDALLETIRSSPEWMPATRDGIPCEGSVEIVLDLTPKIDPQKRPDMISVTTLAEPLFPPYLHGSDNHPIHPEFHPLDRGELPVSHTEERQKHTSLPYCIRRPGERFRYGREHLGMRRSTVIGRIETGCRDFSRLGSGSGQQKGT